MRTQCLALVIVALLVVVYTVPVGAGDTHTSKKQLEFGYDMAKRGLWQEALFRFKQAEKLDNGELLMEILNNTAVAYEATGQFNKALATYRRALQLNSKNDRKLKENYARFLEFYQNFLPQAEDDS